VAIAVSRFVGVSLHVAVVLAFGWLEVVRGMVGNPVLLDEIIAATPALLLFLGGWWSLYPIERRLRQASLVREFDDGRPASGLPSRGGYVLHALRHQGAIVIVPVLAIGGWGELIDLGASRLRVPAWLPLPAIQILGMVVVLSLIPAVLRHVWDTVRLGPGPLRDMLENMCRIHGVRIRELLVWRTHGTMMNGAVMGLIGPIRYILLTDALLENLTRTQVEAVMAHELGHVRRRHMIWLGLAALASIALAGILFQAALMVLAGNWWTTDLGQAVIGVGAVAAGLVIFGFASRRFEWQADAFAVQHLSGFQTRRAAAAPAPDITPEAVSAMTSALDTVAYLNHIPRHRFTWRHGSIASRQRRLLALVGQRADRLWPDREARMVKLMAVLAMFVATALGLCLPMVEAAQSGGEPEARRLH
jgi:Zn-dependent protease with chaperone function